MCMHIYIHTCLHMYYKYRSANATAAPSARPSTGSRHDAPGRWPPVLDCGRCPHAGRSHPCGGRTSPLPHACSRGHIYIYTHTHTHMYIYTCIHSHAYYRGAQEACWPTVYIHIMYRSAKATAVYIYIYILLYIYYRGAQEACWPTVDPLPPTVDPLPAGRARRFR